ncbi:hypothetical protein [Oryza sativa Japonica Group]|uniref:Uncharacterized protein n=1 Tax=Oryza sativa subsp. japonica TaxID=39947 RepID=Q5SNG9_ORYSJ|nr:hypothetical protein [Oryza sativa Japonica Group]
MKIGETRGRNRTTTPAPPWPRRRGDPLGFHVRGGGGGGGWGRGEPALSSASYRARRGSRAHGP